MSGVTIAGVTMTVDAAECLRATSTAPASTVRDDLAAIASGRTTVPELLRHCLDGADPDLVGGWCDYVAAIECHVDGWREYAAEVAAHAEGTR